MPTGRDDVRFRGKTGSRRPTAKMTRLTHLGHWPVLACGRRGADARPNFLAGGPRLDDPRLATHTPYFCAMSATVRVLAPVMLQSKNSYVDASAIAPSANARLS